MPQSLVSVVLHIIFSTKNREPLIVPKIRDRLFEYMGAIWQEVGGVPLLINGPTDHIHALVTLPSTRTVADGMRILKSNSSKWVHEAFPAHSRFAWQSGYAAFSVSELNVEAARAYVANQEEHHRTMTFQEEFRKFLHRHRVKFDERYVWD